MQSGFSQLKSYISPSQQPPIKVGWCGIKRSLGKKNWQADQNSVSSDCNSALETCSFKCNLGNYGSDYSVDFCCVWPGWQQLIRESVSWRVQYAGSTDKDHTAHQAAKEQRWERVPSIIHLFQLYSHVTDDFKGSWFQIAALRGKIIWKVKILK